MCWEGETSCVCAQSSWPGCAMTPGLLLGSWQPPKPGQWDGTCTAQFAQVQAQVGSSTSTQQRCCCPALPSRIHRGCGLTVAGSSAPCSSSRALPRWEGGQMERYEVKQKPHAQEKQNNEFVPYFHQQSGVQPFPGKQGSSLLMVSQEDKPHCPLLLPSLGFIVQHNAKWAQHIPLFSFGQPSWFCLLPGSCAPPAPCW